MSPLLSIHEAAEAEINEAIDFYELQSPGLGSMLLDEIERSLQHIREYPEAAPVVLGAVRRRPTAKFPYSILYTIRPDQIRVLALAHQKRRPFYWRDRR